jgi:hypothetical protein
VFHSSAVSCGGSTGWLLTTLIEPTLAEITPELVVMARRNEMAWVGSWTPGSSGTRDAEAWGDALERPEFDPEVLWLRLELGVKVGACEEPDDGPT